MLTCFARAGRSLRFALRPTLRPVLNAAFLSKKKLLQVDPAHPPKPMTVPAEKIQKSPEPHVDLQEASPKDVPPLVNQPTQPTTPVERVFIISYFASDIFSQSYNYHSNMKKNQILIHLQILLIMKTLPSMKIHQPGLSTEQLIPLNSPLK